MSEQKETIRAVVLYETGGYDKLKYEPEYPVLPKAGDDDVVIDVVFASINYIDTYHRTGLYPMPLPVILGRDGAGIARAVGKNVKHIAVGDRVAWCIGSSYASRVSVPGKNVVKVPADVPLRHATALMLQGVTAQYLVRDSYAVKKGDSVLVHAGAGGLGQLLIQICKHLGASVVTTVSNEDKAKIAKAAGADHIINYVTTPDFATELRKIPEYKDGVNVVYDGVGKDTFMGSLKSLKVRGTIVVFGNASGAVPPFDPLLLMRHGSLTFNRPNLVDYMRTHEEFQGRVDEVFKWYTAGVVKVAIAKELPLSETSTAHQLIESRGINGKLLIRVDDEKQNE